MTWQARDPGALRRYVRSRKDKQLSGTVNASAVCNPQAWLTGNEQDPTLPYDGDILPCGLIAWSQFNDTFDATVTQPGGSSSTLPLDVRSLLQWGPC